MTRALSVYLIGVAGWLLLWSGAFSVSVLAARLRLHGSTRGDVLLTARDLIAASVALYGWLLLRSGGGRFDPQPLYVELHSWSLSSVDWILGGLAAAGTLVYLGLTVRRGIRRVPSPNMYMQRHPLIPLRILSFVIFQQAAATLLLLDWSRSCATEGRALIATALIFGLTHFGVACFGLPLRQAVLLTAASGAAMFFWGALRMSAGSIWAPLLTHYLFYIALACRHARLRIPTEGAALQGSAQPP